MPSQSTVVPHLRLASGLTRRPYYNQSRLALLLAISPSLANPVDTMTDIYNKPGFDFSNVIRNNHLASQGVQLPKATSTGTTIVGCLYKDGIVLGADTRATEGPIVADKNCEKIHYITESIRCCGAGTAADTEFTTALISSNMELHALSTGRKPRVITAMTMLKQMLFRYQGHVGAALVLGGVDVTGPQLFTVAPHGSTDKLPYVTMGSGSLAAMAVFESSWRPGMERQEAIDMVSAAISAGIFNDLGSGSNVDVCVITKDRTDMLRNYLKPNERAVKERTYGFRRGTTAIKKETIRKFDVTDEVVSAIATGGGDAMDIS
ncbi:proteasome core particle subunit beta 2 [Tulasnella sp. JGI-2019a]|nr:proteasome core particle subunit beta 2 [Tulasnella sp. JGI-2019a]KAG9010786.1 proteasome core particle subunit beta 2 [Tulasnella sp. JGI-2019a]KAG9029842.1 proteasome core particle subunit beta 2 [Tulasnella sp. JGI-2019a]